MQMDLLYPILSVPESSNLVKVVLKVLLTLSWFYR